MNTAHGLRRREVTARDEARFASLVTRTPSPQGCRVWLGGAGMGFRLLGRNVPARQVAWVLRNNTDLPPGHGGVTNTCSTPGCVEHTAIRAPREPRKHREPRALRMTPDTVADARRRVAAGETIAAVVLDTGIPQGTVYSAVRGRTWKTVPDPVRPTRSVVRRLTTEKVTEMRRRVAAGESVAAVARQFGVAHSTALPAVDGRTWRNVPTPAARVGYASGERASNAKLTEPDVHGILDALADGEPQAAVARRYGVTQGCVHAIKHGHTWRHIERAATGVQTA